MCFLLIIVREDFDPAADAGHCMCHFVLENVSDSLESSSSLLSLCHGDITPLLCCSRTHWCYLVCELSQKNGNLLTKTILFNKVRMQGLNSSS